MAISWFALMLFMLSVLSLSLYGLAVTGHFPRESRADSSARPISIGALWGTIILAAIATLGTLALGWALLPWYAIAIGGGFVLLMAPLLLQPMPDSFVDGEFALLVFSGIAVAITVLMWLVGDAAPL